MTHTRDQPIRPVRDDVGFCWDARQMERLVSYLEKHEKTTAPEGRLVAGISPHDDYLYAARVYYPLYRKLRAKEVVVFGVTHGTVRRKIGDPKGVVILDDFPRWTGVTKPVEISPLREYIKARL
ncbi:MAG: AmmeMemoRadiSam system protein B, partial [Chlorobi bacterium]|nr:AmmeMemoRadiSam system protein B [Chlorobiota bacterium]